MQYDPKDAVKLWPAGDYDATLVKVEEKTSKVKPDGSGGNPMQVWTWEVYSPDGDTMQVKDYVVVPGGVFKIKQLAIALDLKDAFEAGTFQADDHIGQGVTVQLTVESSPGFEDSNKIKKVKPNALASGAEVQSTTAREPATASVGGGRPARPAAEPPFGDEQQFKEDDIPFHHDAHVRWI